MHHCEAALVTCEDFRLHQRADGRNCVADFVRSQGVDCDIICRAGSIQDLVRPRPGFDESLMRDLAVSVELHRVGRILLVNHQDCGAYGALGLPSPEAEARQHEQDLLEARRILHDRFPDVEVLLFYARLEPGSNDRYVVAPLAHSR